MRRISLCFGLLVFGISSLYADDLILAKALLEEQDWSACIVECQRVELTGTNSTEAAQLRKKAEQKLHGETPRKSMLRRAGEWPVRGLVAFYRSVISPAIGSRCVLEPSCSRYSLEAAKKNGWLGLPMTGDRLVREPVVVQEAAQPVTDKNDRIRYADPVDAHVPFR